MAENENNKQNDSGNENQTNPMKAVNTTSLPVKHEFSSDNSQKNREKRNEND